MLQEKDNNFILQTQNNFIPVNDTNGSSAPDTHSPICLFFFLQSDAGTVHILFKVIYFNCKSFNNRN